MQSSGYRDLIVWQKSMDLVVLIYKLTKEFPDEEKFGLTSQMRRCTVSIPSNIAEGSRRRGEREFRHFLLIAYGSGAELETQLEIAERLSLGNTTLQQYAKALLVEIMRILNAMTSPSHCTTDYGLQTTN